MYWLLLILALLQTRSIFQRKTDYWLNKQNQRWFIILKGSHGLSCEEKLVKNLINGKCVIMAFVLIVCVLQKMLFYSIQLNEKKRYAKNKLISNKTSTLYWSILGIIENVFKRYSETWVGELNGSIFLLLCRRLNENISESRLNGNIFLFSERKIKWKYFPPFPVKLPF